MTIISITILLRLNQELQDHSLPFKIHLKDACGRQSLWIEETVAPVDDSLYYSLYETLEQFFQKERIVLQYSADKKTFWAANPPG